MSARRSLRDRFLELAYRSRGEGCWLWKGGVHGTGYAIIADERRRQRLAHRVSYEILVGPIPDGLLVCHRCDVRNCINPAHLFLGTHSDNTRDAMQKGRFKQCEGKMPRSSSVKLSENDVRDIRALYRAGVKGPELGRRYGLTRGAAVAAAKGRSWKEII